MYLPLNSAPKFLGLLHSFLLCFLISHIACFCSLDLTWVLVGINNKGNNFPNYAENVETKLDFEIVCKTNLINGF